MLGFGLSLGGGGLRLPTTGLSFKALVSNGLIDDTGISSRAVQKKWYLLGDNSGYLASSTIVGTETVVSKTGTAATLTVAAGRIYVSDGTLYSFVLSNGSHYEYPTRISTTVAVMFDVSGNGRHLTLTGYTLNNAIVESLTVGSDWLNQIGYSERYNYFRQSCDMTNAAWAKTSGTTVAAGNVVSFAASKNALVTQQNIPVTIGRLVRLTIPISAVTRADQIIRLHIAMTSSPFTEIVKSFAITDSDTEIATMEWVSTVAMNLQAGLRNGTTDVVSNVTAGCARFDFPTVGGLLSFGDSICAFARADAPGINSNSRTYTSIYGRGKGAIYINYGVSGDTLAQISAKFDANAVKAGTIFLEGGLNDCYQASLIPADPNTAMRATMEELITKALLLADNVVVFSINYSDIGPLYDPWCVSYNTWLEAKAAELGLQYVDTRALCSDGNGAQDPSLFIADATHLNRAGHQRIADWLIANVPYTGDTWEPTPTAMFILTGKQPALSAGSADAMGNTLQKAGRVKYSLLRDPIRWPSAPEIIARTGVDNAVYDADGVGKTMADDAAALAALASLADDTYLFGGTKAAALYSVDMSAKAAAIKRYVGD